MRYRLEIHGPRGEFIEAQRGLELSQILQFICNRAGTLKGYFLISQEVVSQSQYPTKDIVKIMEGLQ